MDPTEVLALEVRQYVGGKGLKTLVPSIIGRTAEAQQRKGTVETKQWDEPMFFEEIAAQRPPEEIEVAKRLLAWAKKNATRVWWGKGARHGSFIPVLNHDGTDHQLFTVYTYGSVEMLFQYYKAKPLFAEEAKRLELRDRLNAINGVSIPIDAIARRPNIRLELLKAEGACERLLQTFDWYIEQVRRK